MVQISIALASFNGGRHIDEQLDSLARQTRAPLELVVTDDGSTDQTEAVVARFAARAPFPVHFHKNPERLGFVRNFFRAASLSRGDVIAFCDQDDVWLPHKLQRCADGFADPSVVFVMHGADLVDAALHPLGGRSPNVKEDRVLGELERWPWETHPGFAMSIRAEVLTYLPEERRPSGYNLLEGPAGGGQMAHDQWAWFLSGVFGRRQLIAESLALYRQHGNNAYGAWAGDPLLTRLRRIRDTGARRYHNLAGIAREMVDVLRAIRPDAPAAMRARAEAGAVRCERIAQLMQDRAELYAGRRGIERLRRFASLIAAGGYGDANLGGLGMRAMVKDGLVSVAAPNDTQNR